MDPRSEVVIRQHEYLSGRVLLVNAPTDELVSHLDPEITASLWTWNLMNSNIFKHNNPMCILA